jgi:uncharacterized membrane protein
MLLSGDFEMLAGNLASIGVGAIVATISSIIVCVITLCNSRLLLGYICAAVASQF